MSDTVYAGLGNAFVIVFDAPVDEDAAREVCARTKADGVISATPAPDGADLTMVLRNADGGRAEVSGNGLACLARAAVDAGVVPGPDVVIDTDAGRRTVSVNGAVTVGMGEATIADADGGALAVDVGNPHLVFPDGDVLALGQQHLDVNVEVISRAGDGRIAMAVHERGVGITDACGTGAYASAAAARKWGWVGDRVTVVQPGGPAVVDLAARTYTVEVARVRRAGGAQ
jgi:diaminopimelate epimerase